MDQHNRIKSPEIKPYIYGQLIFNAGTKRIQWAKHSLRSGVGEDGQPHSKEWNWTIILQHKNK